MASTDDFNRADGAPGANWTTATSFTGILISSSQCSTGLGGDVAAFYSAGTFANGQYAQAKINAVDCGIALRMVVGDSFYAVLIEGAFGAGATLTVAKFVSAAYTVIATETVTFNSTDVLYAQIVGTSISVKRNGSALGAGPYTDASLASGKPGIFGFGSGLLDDWEGGDVAAGGGAAPPALMLLGIGT